MKFSNKSCIWFLHYVKGFSYQVECSLFFFFNFVYVLNLNFNSISIRITHIELTMSSIVNGIILKLIITHTELTMSSNVNGIILKLMITVNFVANHSLINTLWRFVVNHSLINASALVQNIDAKKNIVEYMVSRKCDFQDRIYKVISLQSGIVRRVIVRRAIVRRAIVRRTIVRRAIVRRGIVRTAIVRKGLHRQKSYDRRCKDYEGQVNILTNVFLMFVSQVYRHRKRALRRVSLGR